LVLQILAIPKNIQGEFGQGKYFVILKTNVAEKNLLRHHLGIRVDEPGSKKTINYSFVVNSPPTGEVSVCLRS